MRRLRLNIRRLTRWLVRYARLGSTFISVVFTIHKLTILFHHYLPTPWT